MRYRQLTLCAAEAKILLKFSCMPEVEIPKWVLSTAAFHKDVADRLDTNCVGGQSAGIDGSDRPSMAHFLAIMSKKQRSEYVTCPPTLRHNRPLCEETNYILSQYDPTKYNCISIHPLEVMGKGSAELQTEFAQKRCEKAAQCFCGEKEPESHPDPQ